MPPGLPANLRFRAKGKQRSFRETALFLYYLLFETVNRSGTQGAAARLTRVARGATRTIFSEFSRRKKGKSQTALIWYNRRGFHNMRGFELSIAARLTRVARGATRTISSGLPQSETEWFRQAVNRSGTHGAAARLTRVARGATRTISSQLPQSETEWFRQTVNRSGTHGAAARLTRAARGAARTIFPRISAI